MPILEFLQERKRATLSLVLVAVLAIWGWAIWPRQPVLEVTFLSVGQGDGIVLRTPSGKTILVDCGPGPTVESDFDAGDSVVVPFLRRKGINTIDALIISHPHEDHIGGSSAIMRDLDVKNVLDAGIAHPSGTYYKLLETIKDRSIPYSKLKRGQIIDFHDGVKAEVLSPPPGADEPGEDEQINNLSVVLRVTYGKTSLLLTGDSDKESEDELINSGQNLSADVLKVAHHGSAKATSAEWLASVHPQIAVISVGWKNKFGHPSPAALKRLQEAGVTVYRTDENGGVTVTTDGQHITVSTSRER